MIRLRRTLTRLFVVGVQLGLAIVYITTLSYQQHVFEALDALMMRAPPPAALSTSARRASLVALQPKPNPAHAHHNKQFIAGNPVIQVDKTYKIPSPANFTRPLLDTILVNGTIVGNPQFLLQFAVIGFGKCGTSSLMHWLSVHEQTQCSRDEIWHNIRNRVDDLVTHLYKDLPGGPYIYGYKSPADIWQRHALKNFRTHFPHTKLLIGVRHPIRWFESLYNFRIQNLPDAHGSLPHPNTMIGQCGKINRGVCTEKGNFAYALLQMGKQNEVTRSSELLELENAIVGKYPRNWFNTSAVPSLPNDVFVFDMAQLADTNHSRLATLAHDLQHFVGLDTPLPPMVHAKPGMQWPARVQALKDAHKINICHGDYAVVRRELLRLSRQSSTWMLHVLLRSPTVQVSSRDYLITLLQNWQYDPCDRDHDPEHVAPPRPIVTKAVAIYGEKNRNLDKARWQ